MKFLCDSNVWVSLAITGHSHHVHARRWLDTVEERSSVLFCRSTQQAFLRLITTKSVLDPYGMPVLSNVEAWAVYDLFLADPRIVMQHHESHGLHDRWQHYSARDSASPKLWMDAYLAAFAQTGGYQLVTIDAAFTQFAGLDLLLLR